MGEWRFILSVLAFYGLLYFFYTLSEGNLFGLSFGTEVTFATPSAPTGNWIADFISGTTAMLTNTWTFFSTLFLTSLVSDFWWLGFINWALFGTTLYLFIRVIRGGG